MLTEMPTSKDDSRNMSEPDILRGELICRVQKKKQMVRVSGSLEKEGSETFDDGYAD